jgi:signal transduction histidine kinase
VTVTLKFENKGVSLEIVDDGVGFDPATAKGSGGMGLLGIEERVQRIQGSFAIRSTSGDGTTLRVTVRDVEIGSMDS